MRVPTTPSLALLIVVVAVTAGCDGDVAPIENPEDLCWEQDCSGAGQCAVVGGDTAVCICDPGFHSEGMDCVANVPGSECSGVDCDGHGTCVVVNDDPPYPLCICEPGYQLVGQTSCVIISRPDSCEEVDCGANGECQLSDFGAPYCACDPGYHAEGMTCVPTCTVALEELSYTELGDGPVQQGALLVDQDVAYVLGGNTWIMDISDPAHPSVLYTAESDWHGGPGDAVLHNDHLFQIGSHWLEGDPYGLVVYDVSDPADPQWVGEFGNYRGYDMHRKGDLLFLLVSSSLVVLDISDPTSPAELSTTSLGTSFTTIKHAGDFLWLTSTANPPQGSLVLDISNPEDPQEVNRLETYTYWLLGIDGGIACMAQSNKFFTMDVTVPTQPVLLGYTAFSDPDQYGGTTGDAMAFLGSLAVVSVTGLNVVNVADPVNPMQVGYFKSPDASGSRIEGALAARQDGLIVSYYQGGGMSVVQMTCE